MRSSSGQLIAASVLSGLLALTSVDAAMAQGKGPTKPGAGQPDKPKKPLSEAQKKTEAKKLYDQGKEKFDRGDFAGALEAFQAADDLVPGPAPKYWAARSIEGSNKPQDAVAAYQKFLDSNPDPEKHKDKIDDSKSRIDALKKTPGKVKVATAPENLPKLSLTVDGNAQTGTELSVPPGKHKIAGTADGFDPVSQDVDVNYAETKAITLTFNKAATPVAVVPPPEPAPTAAPTQPPKPPKEPHSNVPAFVTLGLAGVGVVFGTVFGIKALGSKSDFNSSPTTDNADATDRNALIADMSFAVALTFGVTGIVLLVSGNDDEPAKAGKAKTPPAKTLARTLKNSFVTPYAGPKGGGAAATLHF